jgi:hypothetical protein
MPGIVAALRGVEEMLAAGAETEGLVSLAFVAGAELELPEDELNAAVRRALLVLASGGDPLRELQLDVGAVTVLAADLDSTPRRRELGERLAALRRSAHGLPLVEGAIARLVADPELAWRAWACAVLADELGEG